MRIAFVPAARLLSDTEPNGESLIAINLMRALAARGHDLLAYCEHDRLSRPIPGVEVREMSAAGPTVAAGRLRFARRIAADAARERFDIAHLLFPFNTADGYTLVRNAPLVAGPVNLPWPASVARKQRLAARAANAFTDRLEHLQHARTLRRASRLLMTGRSSIEGLPADVRDKVTEVPFGVDVQRFPATPVPEDPAILFLSVLQPRKGVEVLLRALPYVRSSVPRAHVVIAGHDPQQMTASLQALARDLGVADAVRFVGPVPPEGCARIYASARVFCQPSHGEPFGMTVIEAMATGRPVVGTATGGIGDAVVHGKGGLLAPPGDPRLLADALVQVLRAPGTAERMGAFNRARVEERYALDAVVARIEAVYEQVLGGKGSAHAA